MNLRCRFLPLQPGHMTVVCCWFRPQPLFSENMGEPFIVLHSVSHVQAGVHAMEVLLLGIRKDPEETKGSEFSVNLEWITVTNTEGQGGRCTRNLQTYSSSHRKDISFTFKPPASLTNTNTHEAFFNYLEVDDPSVQFLTN